MKKLLFMSAAALLMAACNNTGKTEETKETETKLTGSIGIDGSSTVYPITEAVVETFNEENTEVKITVAESGTGGGFEKFSRKEIDICDASRPIKESEAQACKDAGISYTEFMIAYDGLAVVVNKENNWVDKLTTAELKKIWEPAAQDKITKWNQIRPNWPNEKINLMGPGTASGTFDFFTEAINGKKGDCRGDYTASEDDNILVQGVSGDKNGLAFFGMAYYESNKDKLKEIPVDDMNEANGAGAISPNKETVKNKTYAPLSRPLYIYVNNAALARPEVRAFVEFYLTHAAELSEQVGYVALDAANYDKEKAKLPAAK